MYHSYTNVLTSEVLVCIIVIFIFTVGAYHQIKKIQICLKEDGVGTKLEITNSIVVTFHLFNCITLYGITYVVKDLYMYTGEWFCFCTKIVLIIGDAHMMGHSFLIALVKLLVIVHAETDMVRKEKIKDVCFYINCLYGIVVVGILNIARPDYVFVYHNSMADRCFGRSGVMKMENNTTSAANLVQLCDISYPSQQLSFEYVLVFMRKFICWLDVSFIYLNAANVLEGLCYLRTFAYMNSKVNPTQNPIAEEHLSESSNTRNQRKLLVNAQITAVLSLIEVIYFFGYVITISAVKGTSSEAVIIIPILLMILYLIILPYAFLMNTSHNKNHIIDYGWVNVVKNMTINNSVFASDGFCGPSQEDTNEGRGNQGDAIIELRRSSENNQGSASTHQLSIYSSSSLRSDEGNKEITVASKNKVFNVLKHNLDSSSHKFFNSTENSKSNQTNIISNSCHESLRRVLDKDESSSIETIYL